MANTAVNAWKHIRRSPHQALAAIAVLTVTLYFTLIFLVVSYGTYQILAYFETRPQVTVFFEDNVVEGDVYKLKLELESLEFVSEVKYVSKEEALAIYREQNKDDPLLLEMVTAEILPSSLEISGVNAEVLPKIAEAMQDREGVEEVVYQKDVVESLQSWTRATRVIGIVLVGVLVLTSILITVVITGMKISARRHEIEVLNLLGASRAYINNPFLFEGMFYGVVGAVVAWMVVYISLLYATPFLVSFLGDIPLLPFSVSLMLLLLAASVFFGSVIGGGASLIAVRRFLRS